MEQKTLDQTFEICRKTDVAHKEKNLDQFVKKPKILVDAVSCCRCDGPKSGLGRQGIREIRTR